MAKVKRPRKIERRESSTNWVLIGGGIAVAVIALFALLFLALQTPEPAEAVELGQFCSENPENCVSYGPEDAPVTVVEVYDYACPACGNFALTAGQQIQEAYFDNPDVRWVYFPYSLPQFRGASPASSLAALCVADIDPERFEPFHEGLFEIQASPEAHTRAGFEAVAEDVGVDVEALGTCLDQGRFRAQVEENYEAAELVGLDATPSFYVNGRKYTNIGTFQQIQQIVEPLLQ